MPAPLDRRTFLSHSIGAVGAVAAALRTSAQESVDTAVREYTLTASPSVVQPADGTPWPTWVYNGQVPGPELRVREGERLRVTLENRLPEPTTIHWHGIPLPNAMDGVPDVTQPAVMPANVSPMSTSPRRRGRTSTIRTWASSSTAASWDR